MGRDDKMLFSHWDIIDKTTVSDGKVQGIGTEARRCKKGDEGDGGDVEMKNTQIKDQ